MRKLAQPNADDQRKLYLLPLEKETEKKKQKQTPWKKNATPAAGAGVLASGAFFIGGGGRFKILEGRAS